MEIVRQKYFHIHHTGIYEEMWKVGNQIVFSKEKYNEFFEFYCRNNFSIAGNEGILSSEQKLKECGMLIRELIYEEVRKEHFSNLPSRRHCIWLCDAEGLKFWKNILYPESRIYEVLATGNIHEAYEDSLNDSNINYEYLSRLAREYWRGYGGGKSEKKEYILEGKVEILKEINS